MTLGIHVLRPPQKWGLGAAVGYDARRPREAGLVLVIWRWYIVIGFVDPGWGK